MSSSLIGSLGLINLINYPKAFNSGYFCKISLIDYL